MLCSRYVHTCCNSQLVFSYNESDEPKKSAWYQELIYGKNVGKKSFSQTLTDRSSSAVFELQCEFVPVNFITISYIYYVRKEGMIGT